HVSESLLIHWLVKISPGSARRAGRARRWRWQGEIICRTIAIEIELGLDNPVVGFRRRRYGRIAGVWRRRRKRRRKNMDVIDASRKHVAGVIEPWVILPHQVESVNGPSVPYPVSVTIQIACQDGIVIQTDFRSGIYNKVHGVNETRFELLYPRRDA